VGGGASDGGRVWVGGGWSHSRKRDLATNRCTDTRTAAKPEAILFPATALADKQAAEASCLIQ